MAAEENRFEDSAIYRIDVGDDFYIGSAENYITRKRRHKNNVLNPSEHAPLYKAIWANDNKYTIKKLYDFPCKNKEELHWEERRCCEELKPTLNERQAIISTQERKDYLQNYMKEYNKNYKLGENREKYLKKKKEHYEKYKEEIKLRVEERIICECGKECARGKISRHRKTKAHIKIMEEV
tara:strand:+ start:162 stop:704 length:543 start_codon:yes stop_codon:yes gene_type:complete